MSFLDKIKKLYEDEGFEGVEIHEWNNGDVIKYDLVISSHTSDNPYDYGAGMEEKFLQPINKIKELRDENKKLEIVNKQLELKIKDLEQYKTFYTLYRRLNEKG
jgi:hypothetical protein